MSTETEMTNPWDVLEEPDTRTPRSLETREKSQRRTVWQEPTMLPDPDPEDGFIFKWVRTASRGTDDKINYQKRLREGWEAVRAEDHPEVVMGLNLDQQTGIVEVGGLVLCKMPEEMVEQRRAYYQRRTADEMDAAEQNYMRDSDERMRKIAEVKRRTVFGR